MRLTLLAIASVALTGCMEAQMQGDDDTMAPQMTSARVTEGLQLLYTFHDGKGLVVKDESGVEPTFDLELDNLLNNKWIEGGGIEITGPSVITSPEVAEKVFGACVLANAITIEAWIEPANIEQAGTIFAYERDGRRNAALSVDTTHFDGQVLTSHPDSTATDGVVRDIETIQTPDNIASATAQHVVYTRDASGAAVYVDGVDTKPPSQGGTPPTGTAPTTDQTQWSPNDQLVLGNVTRGDSGWLGKVYLVAIYAKKLAPAEIQKNFAAGH